MKLFISTLLLLVCFSLLGQNFVGLPKTEIIKIMNKTNPGFDLDEGAVNNTYKYLKYVDKFNEETWLFFLSDKDICTKSKLMSDYSNLNNRLKYLNEQYKKAGNMKWIYIDNKGVTYMVDLVKEEWYFTIVTSKKK
jgi:hypothetical protein